MPKVFFLTSILLASCVQAFGQAGAATASKTGDEYGLIVGNSLINQISGIREMMSFVGLTYATDLGPGKLEPHYFKSNAYDTQYHILGASYRVDFDSEDLTFYGGGGFDGHYFYTPEDKNYRLVMGGHFMGGAMIHVAHALWLRGEMRFYMSPGFNLFYGFGLTFRLPDGGGGAN